MRIHKNKPLVFLYFFSVMIMLVAVPIVSAADQIPPQPRLWLIFVIIIAVLLLLILALLLFLLWIFMLLDCIKREFDTKFKWLLLLNLVPFAQVFYYYKIKKPDIKNDVSKRFQNFDGLETMSIISFVGAVIAMMMFPYFGFLFGIPAIIVGNLARKKFNPKAKIRGIELARAGIVLGIVAIILQVLFLLFYLALIFSLVMMPAFMMQENLTANPVVSSAVSDYYPAMIRDSLAVGEARTYTIEGDEYAVQVLAITDDMSRVSFLVNGEELSVELGSSTLIDDVAQLNVITFINDDRVDFSIMKLS